MCVTRRGRVAVVVERVVDPALQARRHLDPRRRQPLHLLMVALGLLLFFVFIKKKAWNEFYDRNINHLNEK